MPKTDKDEVIEALCAASRVLVTSHVNPDGDAVGSVLALAQLARSLGADDVVMSLHDPVPRVYDWLAGVDEILPPDEVTGSFDTVLIADANSCERVGAVCAFIKGASTVVIVDHHLTEERNGTVHLIDSTYAATGEIVVDLFEAAGVELDCAVAECLYVALSTDTGNFRYANTTARSHRAAARLIETGINVREITSRVIDTMTIGKFRLLRRLLDRAELGDGGRIAHGYILERDLAETGALAEDVDGLINYLRNLEGVQLAILIRESEPAVTKVSFRSQPTINAAEIAQHFGGGGHAMAAGATLPYPLQEAKAELFRYLRGALKVDL
ncbi:MAG: DHH family phosphoesterase [Candidatus Hydrogenedentota bacterium]